MINKEVGEVSIVIDGFLTVINLGLREIDVLSLFRVELNSEERILRALHSSYKRTTLIIIADCSGSKDRSKATIC